MRQDGLEPLGLSVAEGAKGLGVTRQAMNNLINGKAGISAEMAIRLEKAFAGPRHGCGYRLPTTSRRRRNMLQPGPVRQRRADIGLLPDRNRDRVTPCKPKNGQPPELYDYKT